MEGGHSEHVENIIGSKSRVTEQRVEYMETNCNNKSTNMTTPSVEPTGSDGDSDDLQFVDNLEIDTHLDFCTEVDSSSSNSNGKTEDSTVPPAMSMAQKISSDPTVASKLLAPLIENNNSTNNLEHENLIPSCDKPPSLDGTSAHKAFEEDKVTIPATFIKHCLDGFIIEESSEPFPVHRSSLLTDLQKKTRRRGGKRRMISSPAVNLGASGSIPPSAPVTPKPITLAVSLPTTPVPPPADTLNEQSCTLCGQECLSLSFYRNNAYCSTACLRIHKKQIASDPGHVIRRGRPIGAMTRNKPTIANCGKIGKMRPRQRRRRRLAAAAAQAAASSSDLLLKVKVESCDSLPSRPHRDNGYESEESRVSANRSELGREDVMLWSVDDVRNFIQCLEGCSQYATIFQYQEIDGHALLLLNEDHLLNALDVKLGPALKIFNRIKSFR